MQVQLRTLFPYKARTLRKKRVEKAGRSEESTSDGTAWKCADDNSINISSGSLRGYHIDSHQRKDFIAYIAHIADNGMAL